MDNLINNKPSMTSLDIAELVGSRPDKVKQSIERLAERGVITLPPMGEKATGGRPTTYYIFEGEDGKRDSIIVVAHSAPSLPPVWLIAGVIWKTWLPASRYQTSLMKLPPPRHGLKPKRPNVWRLAMSAVRLNTSSILKISFRMA